MADNSQPKKKLYTIQVLRGLAAVLVVLAHGDLIFNQNFGQNFWFKIFNFGGSGVDFFFVLSGFIILYVHKKDIANKSKTFTFLFKRFLRIYPIYWVFLSLKLLASFSFSYNPSSTERSLIEMLKAFTLFPQQQEVLSSSFLGVSWTLSYEILFYIIFALLIALPTRISFPIVGVWLLGVFGNFWGLLNLPPDSVFLKFIFSHYNLEFALGCLAAYLFARSKIKWGMVLISVGAFLYTLSAINYHHQIVNLSQVITFGIPSMLLVLGCVSLENTKNIQVPPLLVYLGDASYSIYLAHGFAINNISKLIQKIYPSMTENIFVLNSIGLLIAAISIVFGCLVHSFIEKPLILTFQPRKTANA
ncbi:Acyltransferase 3 [Trichormus variabilis ATCC 29413]|uniref:Acyltransferase 3 n=4 Tax=Anabaena variabilis TaxID=264691 RepID=Q3MEW2_TRIV2|nr:MULTISPECIES: acyltransferase [Nostocaceae]ABA20474.1 Acyltransferase 3 [Trichormus variabilis ATCC 29413]MBC1215801.1 acyltransferase [Trichormus variabilis ARAD]MBC1267979.1 acyltransferase [Trichormus variabilis FSR]MBC1304375.1 acyltransferase [Trichormus variabilis N2B]MBC1312861.1 acyltransferase [Trichormus variabilis PNB]